MIANSMHTKLGLPMWRVVLNIGDCAIIPTRGLLATDHVILNHGQVTWSSDDENGNIILTLCKEPLPAPGNRSNERRYREKDLATTERGKKVGTEE
ncbi:hypothetical protein TNCV_1715581 [Trichonephila clavipes]|nr:hypothetical protein TNCV_1715581 [Trichonephila clavipes]